jgi:hypothetical protein
MSSLPAPLADGGAYLRVVHVGVPDNVAPGQSVVLSVTAEWSDLNVFYVWQGWDRPVIRFEICEGNDVATCKTVGFAPSAEGEVVKPSGSATYAITVEAPGQPMIWHLIAVIEVLAAKTNASLRAIRRGDWAVISWSGYDPWEDFEIPVKPEVSATIVSHNLLSESFESGDLASWEQEGLVLVTNKNPLVIFQREGHTGDYAVLLGVYYSGNIGQFALRRAVAVAPGSDLTVTFWYRGVYPYGSSGSLPRMLLTFSVISSGGTLDQVTIQNTATKEMLTDDWRSLTRSITVPIGVTSVILQWAGTGDSQAGGNPFVYAGGYELDDVKLDERIFSTTTALTTSQTQTTSLAETVSSTSTSTLSRGTGSSVPAIQSDHLEMWWLYAVIALVLIALGALVFAKRPRSKKTSPVTVFCTDCGASLPKGSTYCNKCGSKQE